MLVGGLPAASARLPGRGQSAVLVLVRRHPAPAGQQDGAWRPRRAGAGGAAVGEATAGPVYLSAAAAAIVPAGGTGAHGGVAHRLRHPGVVRFVPMGVLVDITPLRVSPDFRRLWFGQAISLVGTTVTAAALPFQVFAITDSSLAVGLLGLAQLGPLLLFSVIGGALADSRDKRLLLLGVSAAALCGAGPW